MTVSSEGTSIAPWYDDFIVPSGEKASDTINMALEKLRSRGVEGGRLVIKEGIYDIDKPIELYGGETIEGQGPKTVLRLADNANCRVFSADAFAGPTRENIIIRNLSLLGNEDNGNSGGQGITINNAANIVLQQLIIKEFGLWSISIDSAEGVSLDGLSVEQKGSSLWSAIYLAICNDVLVQGLTVENNSNVECVYFSACEQLRIIDNVFRSGYSRNIFCHTCPGIVISNNIVKDAYTGIYVDFGEGAVITGNDVSACTNIGIFVSRSNGATITSNLISNSGSAAVDITESSYVDVISNQCRDSYVGIYVDNDAEKTKVSVNDLIGNQYGIVNYGTGTDTSGDNRVT